MVTRIGLILSPLVLIFPVDALGVYYKLKSTKKCEFKSVYCQANLYNLTNRFFKISALNQKIARKRIVGWSVKADRTYTALLECYHCKQLETRAKKRCFLQPHRK